jgi:hypothetical protein
VTALMVLLWAHDVMFFPPRLVLQLTKQRSSNEAALAAKSVDCRIDAEPGFRLRCIRATLPRHYASADRLANHPFAIMA